MSEYVYNGNKPEKLLTGYNTVRGAELKEIYKVLENQGAVPEDALKERFGRPDWGSVRINSVHVDRCLKFLRAVDMVEISGQGVVLPMNQDVYPAIDAFEPRLLLHLRQQEANQYHLTYVFDVAVGLNRRRIPEDELLEAVIEDDSRSFGLNWNDDNIRMWANLADPLGAVSYLSRRGRSRDDNEVMTAPTRRLLADLLRWHREHGEDPDRFARALEWIDDEIIPVFSDSTGTPRVSVGVADILNNMDDEGVLSLNDMTDTEDDIEVPFSNREESRNVATYDIHKIPEQPSYHYPLERDEREVVA